MPPCRPVQQLQFPSSPQLTPVLGCGDITRSQLSPQGISLLEGTELSVSCPQSSAGSPHCRVAARCSQLLPKAAFFVLLQRPIGSFSQVHVLKHWVVLVQHLIECLHPSGMRHAHHSLPKGRAAARTCPSPPGTARSPATIPETAENPLPPVCQKDRSPLS